jgi:hypothetical protein
MVFEYQKVQQENAHRLKTHKDLCKTLITDLNSTYHKQKNILQDQFTDLKKKLKEKYEEFKKQLELEMAEKRKDLVEANNMGLDLVRMKKNANKRKTDEDENENETSPKKRKMDEDDNQNETTPKKRKSFELSDSDTENETERVIKPLVLGPHIKGTEKGPPLVSILISNPDLTEQDLKYVEKLTKKDNENEDEFETADEDDEHEIFDKED